MSMVWNQVRRTVLPGMCALLIVLSGCGETKVPPKSADELGLLGEGVLKVGMEFDRPPFMRWTEEEQGKNKGKPVPVGLDVELANALSAQWGLNVELVEAERGRLLAGLDAGLYDCVISAAAPSPDADFSDPYAEYRQTIVIKPGSPPITSPENLSGLTVGYQTDTASAAYMEDLLSSGAVSCTVVQYDRTWVCLEDLRMGRIDAVLCDSAVARGYVRQERAAFEITWQEEALSGTFAVAVKTGNEKLLRAVNDALKELEREENGTLSVVRKWLG